jgi:predicted N-acyltransferase
MMTRSDTSPAAAERTARVLHGIDEIDAARWNQCANPGASVPFDPFVSHAFLHALEASGSATAQTGWQPFHLALEEPDQLLGVVPMYLKGHSQGEYVFDYAWADAWHRAGQDYYPKLQVSVPFTPATGRRMLAAVPDENLRRERREALAAGIEVEWLTGSELREAHWDAFYRFYMDTGSRKWGSPYLTRRFFSLIGDTMAEHVLLILCRRAGRYVAGALNFIGGDTLFGRNWGCIEHHPFLHFETCYYQAIDFAIQHGLARVEAGAQGAHKVARGYLPQATYSAHWISNAGFRDAVRRYLEDERRYVADEIQEVERRSPFKATVDLGRTPD